MFRAVCRGLLLCWLWLGLAPGPASAQDSGSYGIFGPLTRGAAAQAEDPVFSERALAVAASEHEAQLAVLGKLETLEQRLVRAGTAERFSGLGAVAAKAVALESFPDALAKPAWRNPLDSPGTELIRSLSRTSALVRDGLTRSRWCLPATRR